MKKRYIIYFNGLFEQGYVRHTFFKVKRNKVKLETREDVLRFATKHRFKFVANLYCKMYNTLSRQRLDFRVYKVICIQI